MANSKLKGLEVLLGGNLERGIARFYDGAASAKHIALQSPTSLVADFTLTLPPAAPTVAGQYMAFQTDGTSAFATLPSGVTTFLGLTDTPSAYTSQTLKFVRVNAGETALEFITATPTLVGLGNVDNVQQLPMSYLDTDGTLAANSDVKVASQKASKTYIDGLIAAANALVYKGVIDCSTNPNYPAADAGDLYVVSVSGKIGGASGLDVVAGDLILCKVDATASGTQAAVGANWDTVSRRLDNNAFLNAVQEFTQTQTFTSPVIKTDLRPNTNGGASVGTGTLGMSALYLKDTATADVYSIHITSGVFEAVLI